MIGQKNLVSSAMGKIWMKKFRKFKEKYKIVNK